MPATTGNDSLIGTNGADTLDGLAGNDTLVGGAGNDVLSGGGGIDTAVFNSLYSNYKLTRNANGSLTVSTTLIGGDGTDVLSSVESLKFSDALVMPTMAGASAEVKVSSTITSGGGGRIAKLQDGGWVVIWSTGTSTATAILYGQRYSAAGTTIGSEFIVNPSRVGNYDYGHFHSISGLSDGGWIINWVGIDSSSDYGVFGQRFTSGGVATGGVISVTANKLFNQIESSVTGLSDGGWLSVWSNRVSDGSYDIAMRRFSSSGSALTSDITANTFKTGYQEKPFVAALSNGGWVVAWQSNGQDAANDMGVYGQAYKADGTALGKEFRANTTTSNSQSRPAVAGLADGGWVVVWQSYGQDAMDGVYGQRYDATGVASGGEFRVNTYTANSQRYPTVTALKDGGWVVVWESEGQDGSLAGIYGQRYGSNGAAIGSEFRVNATTDNAQMQPSVSALEDGGWVVSWMSTSATPSKYGILFQRYGSDGVAFSTAYSLNVTGDATSQAFAGTAYSDTLSGMDGNDTLDGGGGADSMVGGLGNDTFSVDNSNDAVVELTGEGTDKVIASIDYTLPANVENFEFSSGSTATSVTGNVLNNSITANNANNTIDGGAGADTMAGAAGDDVYFVDTVGDKILEQPSAGTDSVISGVSYTLDANVEAITLTGTANLSATGNVLNNTLTGNAGVDTLSGGLGDDTYVIGNASTVIVESVSSGTDVVRSSFSHVLRENVENLVLLGSSDISGTGNASANAIVGNTGSNTLDGGGGADTLTGGAGNDLYFVNVATDIIVEQLDEGVDEVRSSANHTLFGNVEILTLIDSANLIGTGNALNNTLTGNSGIDTLIGGAGDDLYIVNNTADQITELSGNGTGIDEVRSHVTYTLSANIEKLTLTGSANIVGTGNDSNNTIISNAGINTLIGGGGDDSYFVDQSADLVVEMSGGGAADEVYSLANYVLPDQVEKLTLTGWIAVNGAGNAQANIIFGNTLANSLTGAAGNDSIDGGVGADTLVGGTGDDVYYVDDLGDKVVEVAAEGTDLINSSVSMVLPDHVEHLQLSWVNAINGTGNALANQITGNDAANSLTGGDGHDTLNGGAGADTLVGGNGDDVYFVADATDIVIEATSAGTDTVFSSASYRMSSNIENLTIYSGAAIDGVGNALDNVITGSYGANLLVGAAGDDTLIGSGGADTLAGGLGYDTAVFSGKISDYVISQNTSTGGIAYTVADQRQGMDATDLVIGVERLKFSDGIIQLVQTTSAATLPDVGVNTFKTSLQQDPAVTGFDDGSFVVAWASYGSDGSVWGIAGQRYNAAGLPQGSEFIVNTTTFDGQLYPSVTSLPDQGFVVTWQSNQFDLSGYGIAGQRFDASGQKLGSEFLVNNIYKVNAQSAPAVVGLADGGFAVVWQSFGVDGSGLGVCGRLYAATGLPRTDEFKINTTTTGDQDVPSVAALTNGGFVTTWRQATIVTSGTTTTTSITLNAQRYDSLGNKNGAEFRVGARAGVLSADVTGLSDGGFVVTYVSGNSIYAQRYSSTGVAVPEIKVNTSASTCMDPHVATNPVGGYVVTWTSTNEDGSGYGVYGRSYAADGSSQGVFRVNDNTAGDQRDSELAIAGDSLIVTWDSSTVQDGDATGIALRRFDLNGKLLWSRFDVTGDSSAQSLTGSEYGEKIHGLEGEDTLYGLAGNDSIDGGAGSDNMIGGTGNDIYWVDHANDRIVEGVSAGTDTVFATANFALQENVENLIMAGGDNLSAYGNSLANTLTGNAGDNTLNGGANNDTYSGAAGDDVYVVADYGDVIIEISGEGVDTVISSIDYTLPSEVENLTLINGSSYRGTGNALENFIVSGGGNDTLDGGLGIDSYAGGAGDDVYYIDRVDEIIVETALGGIDTVYSSVSYTLGENLENLRLNGYSAATGVGNALANYITGDTTRNFLSGEDGNDTLDGVGGWDTLAGGAGDDTYVVNNSTDFIVEKDGEGVDTARSTVNYSIENTYVDNLVLVSGFSATGNALSNYIEGNSLNNTINGLAGADTMAGMQGADIYYVDNVGDVIVEASSAGVDIVISTVSFKLDPNVDSLRLIGTGNLSGTGNELDNSIEGADGDNWLDGSAGNDQIVGYGGQDTLLGGAGNDFLNGVDGNDSLIGGDGNDTLWGGMGQDTMSGGSGDDIYEVNDALDVVLESANGGLDVVNANANFRLGDNQEILFLLGGDSLSGGGNSLANTITGNYGDNFLDGAGGADTLDGGSGNDTLIGGAGDDLMVGGGGSDVAVFSGKYADYTISYGLRDGLLVSGLDGEDSVRQIETLRFSDAMVTLGSFTEVPTTNAMFFQTFAGLTLPGKGIGTSVGKKIQTNAGISVEVSAESNPSALDVFLKRTDANGNVLSKSVVNSAYQTGHQFAPTIAAGKDGSLLVVWASTYNFISGNKSYDDSSIWLQKYTSSGIASGSNTSLVRWSGYYPTNSGQSYNNPDITPLSDGGFLVVWETYRVEQYQPNPISGYDIYAQRLDAYGNSVGANFRVNSDGFQGNQYLPKAYGLADGGWVITWMDVTKPDSNQANRYKVYNSSGQEIAVGTGYFSNIQGDQSDQSFFGTSFGDVLDSGGGADTLTGGAGDDTYIVSHTSAHINEAASEGRDSVSSSVSFALPINVEVLTLTGSADISGTGNNLQNFVTGNSGNNTLDGAEGNDTLAGGAGNDVYLLDSPSSDDITDVVIENWDAGTDTVMIDTSYVLNYAVENLTLTGVGNISGSGNELDNLIVGNAGANTLSGGLGADTLIGSAGDDTYIVDGSGDTVIENAEEGSDTLVVESSYTLSDNFENLVVVGSYNAQLSGNAANNDIRGNGGSNTIDGGAGIDTMRGNAGDDVYLVDSKNDRVIENDGEGVDTVYSRDSFVLGENVENLFLSGTESVSGTGNVLSNLIVGNSGDNTLDGAQGNDTLTGGSGNDVYLVDDPLDMVSESADSGIDEVRSAVDFILGDALENLTLIGSGVTRATGNTLDNVLRGNNYSNTLDGGAGIDTLEGGTGDDVYQLGSDADVVIEQADSGIDTVRTSLAYALGDNLENLELLGDLSIDGKGNALPNLIVGNAGNNRLEGLAGDDTLIGLSGQDTLAGGDGNDTYAIDNTADVVVELAGQGRDRIISSVSYTLTDTVEDMQLVGASATAATGNAQDNALTGSEGDNTLDGGAGADTLIGGAGSDIYIVDTVGDLVFELDDPGTDEVRASIDYTLGDQIENLSLLGSVSLIGRGNSVSNKIDGNLGNNTLDGGLGADTFSGAAGDDVYVIDDAGDVVIEQSGEGIDEVRSSVSVVLAENVENLLLTGGTSIFGKGNQLNNLIIGNGAANTMEGAAGDDTMVGGSGDDLYLVTEVGDIIVEVANNGRDEVRSTVGYVLTEHVENLVLQGSASSARGNALDNFITGNAENNFIDGAAGSDSMAGGAGDDVYIVESTGDRVTETLGQGIDEVRASITYTLVDHVENLVLTGTANLSGYGNSLHNAITGNFGENTLDGGVGADTLSGGIGDDLYLIDNANDVIIEVREAGVDQVIATVSYTLSDNVDHLSLAGSARSGTGNALDNLIIGHSGDNVLMGLDGNDTLNGAGGNDSFIGGSGDDIYFVDSISDIVVEANVVGRDRIYSRVAYNLVDNVEELVLDDVAGAVSISGNALDNYIAGNTSANKLTGGSGNDTLIGGGASSLGDTLDGGFGADILVVSGGNNLLTGGFAADRFEFSGIVNTENTITDFESGDTLQFSDLTEITSFSAGSSGNLNRGQVSYQVGAGGTDIFVGLSSVGDLAVLHLKNFFAPTSLTISDNKLGVNINSAPKGAPAISGAATEGVTLVASQGSLSDSDGFDVGAFSWQWQRSTAQGGWQSILGATAPSFLLTQADVGNQIRVVASYTDGKDVRESKAAEATVAVANINDLPSSFVVQVDGGTSIGASLTASAWAVDEDGVSGQYAFQWQRGIDLDRNGVYADSEWVDITGATSASYQVATLDSGKALRISVSYIDLLGTRESTFSRILMLDSSGELTLNGDDASNDIIGSQGRDVIRGAAGDDRLYGWYGDDVLQGDEGNDQLEGEQGDDTLYGGDGNDFLTGGTGFDWLFGGVGDDTLDGSVGADTMDGGEGSDVYFVDNPADVVTDSGSSAGNDVVYLLFSQANRYTLGSGIDTVQIADSTQLAILEGNDGNNLLGGNASANELIGGAGNDSLNGGNGMDTLYGGSGNDVVSGDAGNDLLIGGDGAGDDTYLGGEGVDTIKYTSALAGITVDLSRQFNQVYSTDASNAAGIGIDQLFGIENVIAGNYADNLSGNAVNNVFTGGSGNDTINGGGGKDTAIYSGRSTDYLVTSASGRVTVQAMVGSDGIDILTNIESLAFSDKTVVLKSKSVNTAPTGGVVITGGATENSSLTVDTSSLADSDGLGKFALQWQRLVGTGWVDITKATTASYKLIAADVGYQVRAKVSYKDLQKTAEVVYSDATTAVANVNDAPLGVPTIVGTLVEGSTLIAAAKITDLDGLGTFNYEWEMLSGSNWATVGTGTSYTLLNDSMGKQVRVVVSYTDKQGTTEVVTGTTSAVIATNALKLAGKAKADVLSGMSGKDSLNGNAGNDRLFGNGGDDTLTGGAGADELYGGSGADAFIYTAITDSSVTAGIDTIFDFTAGDKINLTLIDANTKVAKDQAFVFSEVGLANAVWTVFDGANTFVYADHTGDTSADLTIKLAGQVNLTGSDFNL
jgi:Ca2+-binding RTX toxin-like protein